MHKIIVANNLIGDSLYVLKPLDMYLEKFGAECKGIVTLPQLGGDIVKAHFTGRIPLYSSEAEALEANPGAQLLPIQAGRAMEIGMEHHKRFKKVIHISEAFAYMLGVNVDNMDSRPPLEWIPERQPKDPKHKIAIISPFSKSCTRHSGLRPNKTIDDWKWEYIIRYLRRHDYHVLCTCASDDLLKYVSLPLSSYRSTNDLTTLLKLLQSADIVVSLDNGTAHLASACDVPTVVLWSGYSALPTQFIAPLWSEKTSYVFMGDPNKATPASILYGIKHMLLNMEAKNWV